MHSSQSSGGSRNLLHAEEREEREEDHAECAQNGNDGPENSNASLSFHTYCRTMFEGKIQENVKEGEEVLAIVRRAPIVAVPSFTIAIVLIIAPFFFLYPLLSRGAWGTAAFFVSLGLGLYLGFRALWVQQLNAFILTAERIIDIDQRGLFHRVVSEAPFENVQDVSYVVHGLFATLLQYGSVVVQTAGATPNLELTGIRRPRRIQELILKLQQERMRKDEAGALSADELLAMVHKIKKGIGEEAFRRLVAKKDNPEQR